MVVSVCGVELPFFNNDDSVNNVKGEAVDRDAIGLSYVGDAVYNSLRMKHFLYHNRLWNCTSGRVVGKLHQTPNVQDAFENPDDPPASHDDWFPKKMGEIIARTEIWCDIMSLGPPDGLFMDAFKEALMRLHERATEGKPITVRMMFGNIVGMPVNCNAVMEELTADIPSDTHIRVWVGAWRKGTSWNHAKIIAVDGRYLHTGGHNLWDAHYLKHNPVHDLSLEMEGRVTHDGHLFANEQWAFIKARQDTCVGQIAENIPDNVPLIWKTRVIVSEFPKNVAPEFPPLYKMNMVPRYQKVPNPIQMITIGRLGTLLPISRPSDDAIIAMINSSKKIIRAQLQDLGPVCVPNTKMALPGCSWPKPYLRALGQAIWDRGVDVEIILSNPHSIPGGLGMTEACYGNGWSCVDVAAEIIKTIKTQHPFAKTENLRRKVEQNLRICFMRHKQKTHYSDGTTIGLHSKHFIIDDVCAYIGSQNLYVCDLAEWGVVIDNENQVKKFLGECWKPFWEASFTGEDVDVQTVMDGLDHDRDGEHIYLLSSTANAKMEAAAAGGLHGGHSKFYHKVN